MTRTPTLLARWIGRQRRHTWVPDTRSRDYSVGPLMRPNSRPDR